MAGHIHDRTVLNVPDRQPLDPLLRWAGGKRGIVATLSSLLPSDIRKRRYIEPFAGGAALYFFLRPPVALLSDANSHLIECYRSIARSPKAITRHLRQHAVRSSHGYYYRVRRDYNLALTPTIAQAA